MSINEFELKILDFIQDFIKCDFLDFVMPLITRLGNGGVLWIALAIFLLLLPKYRKTGVMVSVSLILGFILGNGILKNVVARIRPYDLNESVTLLLSKLHDYSFPSGHTLASFEASTVLMIRDKRIGIPALIIAILIAFSRLYLYVHYPTDVIAGAILGAVFGVCSVYLVNRINKLYENKKELRK